MKALDTNILVYAHRKETARNAEAVRILQGLATSGEPWAIPWPCIYEFMRVVTHPRVFHPPTPVGVAWAAIRGLMKSPSLVLLCETERHGEVLDRLMEDVKPTGNVIHDAHIAALLVEHGITEIITSDADFKRFPGIRSSNPFK